MVKGNGWHRNMICVGVYDYDGEVQIYQAKSEV